MKKNWIKNIFRGLSLTSVMFIFQACYGTPQDYGNDFIIEGQVKSKATGLPIKGIKVSVAHDIQYVHTNEEGKFSFYMELRPDVKVLFEDVDGEKNGEFANADTVIKEVEEKVFLDIKLENI